MDNLRSSESEKLPDRSFRFCIDRGGTFTDVFAEVPGEPSVRTLKLLSEDPANYEDAPREGIRRILQEVLGEAIPRGAKIPTARIEWIRMGTTVGTNSLLERTGAKTALCVTKGLGDLLRIGNQARPNIFDLRVKRPGTLFERVVEVDERVILVQDEEGGGERKEGEGEGKGRGGENRVEGDWKNKEASSAPIAVRSCLQGEEEGGLGKGQRVKGVSGEWVEVVQPLDLEGIKSTLEGLLRDGFDSLAIAFMHSYTFPDHERTVAELASSMGFRQVSPSSALVPMIRIVPRGNTACVDAYLTPGIREYVAKFLAGFDEGLERVKVSFMQSDGGLTPAIDFTGSRAILSGPAGGVVGYAVTTFGRETPSPVIGFDMGGTSTDVSRFDGEYAQTYETMTAGVAIQAPQLDINTVAAGGGSKLKFEAGVFRVGPESVSAHPGPVCYRKNGQLAVTDANLVLGRILPEFFPKIFGPQENEALDGMASRAAFEKLAAEINAHRRALQEGCASATMSVEEVAMGFLNVANEAMCRPIRELTEMKGLETGSHVLACFGGAGPQHACAIARALKMKTVVVHKFCGILSAYGMGLADVVAEAQEPCADVYGPISLERVRVRAASLEKNVRENLAQQGFDEQDISTRMMLNLRYQGTDTAIMVAAHKSVRERGVRAMGGGEDVESRVGREEFDFAEAFLNQFRQEYGFELLDRELIIDDVRITGVGQTNIFRMTEMEEKQGEPQAEAIQHQIFFHGHGWMDTRVYFLENLGFGHVLDGPAVIMNGNSTIIVEPGCMASVTRFGNIRIDIGGGSRGHGGVSQAVLPVGASNEVATKAGERNSDRGYTGSGATGGEEDSKSIGPNSHTGLQVGSVVGPAGGGVVDLVQLSIFGNRFMGIAEQMGRTLQRTAISTNIKERLDFSCALFAPDGGLVANAPHVPVHLGAMSSTVRWQLNFWAGTASGAGEGGAGTGLQEGDVLLTNHPASGGSHLPDITVITPVFREGRVLFFVASRGHHSEIGGVTPGSMPPFSRTIGEEGAAIKAMKLVERGVFQEERVREVLTRGQVEAGKAIPGTRKIEDNVSDLRAQVAANQRGIMLINELVAECGLDVVQAYMGHVRENAEMVVRDMLKRVAMRYAEEMPGSVEGREVVLFAEDFMDDGSRISLRLSIDSDNGTAHFDFSGTSLEVYGNWNAPEAVTSAAVIYCLRCLVDVEIPLNQGCLAPVSITIPKGCFLSPSDKAAVVGGNVLTSQRVTDVVLSAFRACADSQGCMNNLTFGDERFGYYETIAGGAGAGADWDGASGVQCHMTNTRMTDPEIFEQRYPVLLKRFGIREGSGGAGVHKGGDGVVREIEFRRPVTVSILSERRVFAPKGLKGGGNGQRGSNLLKNADGRTIYLGGKNTVRVNKGDSLLILTPGGGGWGSKQTQN